MAQNNIEESPKDKAPAKADDKQGVDLISHLINDGVIGGGAAALGGKSLGDLNGPAIAKALGLPSIDLTGFDQEAPYHSQGTVSDILHGIKHAFVKDDTLEDKLRQHVESKMTPEERKKFDNETKAQQEYEHKWMAWAVSTMIPPPPMPEKPKSPMHAELDRRVEAQEKKIADGVRSQMSPTDLKRLDEQMKDYEKRFDDSRRIHNPYGTGEGFRPLPTPGNAIKDYYDRISEATEKVLSS